MNTSFWPFYEYEVCCHSCSPAAAPSTPPAAGLVVPKGLAGYKMAWAPAPTPSLASACNNPPPTHTEPDVQSRPARMCSQQAPTQRRAAHAACALLPQSQRKALPMRGGPRSHFALPCAVLATEVSENTHGRCLGQQVHTQVNTTRCADQTRLAASSSNAPDERRQTQRAKIQSWGSAKSRRAPEQQAATAFPETCARSWLRAA